MKAVSDCHSRSQKASPLALHRFSTRSGKGASTRTQVWPRRRLTISFSMAYTHSTAAIRPPIRSSSAVMAIRDSRCPRTRSTPPEVFTSICSSP